MKWYIKEFSTMTNVSVRTLHHYDDIGLLKPSVRHSTGYRLYSEVDLLKLERIIALKFFGFSLKQIAQLVGNDEDVATHLKQQQQALDAQIEHLHRAIKIIDELTQDSKSGKTFDWSKIASLIKVYNMTDELKQTWAKQVYSEDQLKQFAELKERYSEQDMIEYQNKWEKLLEKVQANLDQDPHSPIAQQLAKEWMELVDEVYGDYPELKDALSMAYKYNKIPNAPFDKRTWDFVEKAVKYLQSK